MIYIVKEKKTLRGYYSEEDKILGYCSTEKDAIEIVGSLNSFLSIDINRYYYIGVKTLDAHTVRTLMNNVLGEY